MQKIGLNAGVIKQAYTVARVRKEARQKGYPERSRRESVLGSQIKSRAYDNSQALFYLGTVF